MPALTVPAAAREALRIVIVGHVDHGKSTLVGRLFHDTGSLPDGRMAAIEAVCRRRGMRFEWAFLTDALQGERDQGVTIDTAHIWFRGPARDYVIIDAPGHREFVRNMVTGAAQADAALLLIDAAEGVREQSRRHAFLLHLLGIEQVVLVINKMDRIDYARDRFLEVEGAFTGYLSGFGITPRFVIPVSARDGDNLVRRSQAMDWYHGPTLIEALDRLAPPRALDDLPLRFPIQDVYKFDDRRILAGRIETGLLRAGDKLLFSPSNKTARVATIETWSAPVPLEVEAGRSVGITLDSPLFIERGEIASHLDRPPIETDVFRARLFWLGQRPMRPDRWYKLKLLTAETEARLQSIERVVDATELGTAAGDEIGQNMVAEVVLRLRRLLALDEYRVNPRGGRFVLADGYSIVGGGVIFMDGYPDQRASVTVKSTNLASAPDAVGAAPRRRRNRHKGGVLWFTGLSGSGKSTLARAVEAALFERGYQVYVLDGDNVRAGLNADLGFGPEDRSENIRRVGEAAALFADAGMIVITAFISPYRADRARARAAGQRVAGDAFHEIFIAADLAVCEARDPKGLYRRARSGEIAEFTGVSAPYEAPETAELVIDTAANSEDQCAAAIVGYVERHLALIP